MSMDIERINDYTLKFFITYNDMEDRGFDREEIWYDRERGEELFWEMMDEAHHEEEFPLEGPMWIQIQAMEKGLEIVVTRAQLSQDGSKLELPVNDDKQVDLPVDENIENMMERQSQWRQQHDKKKKTKQQSSSSEKERLSFVIAFSDFEHVIDLSHRQFMDETLLQGLYYYNQRYYLHVLFPKFPEEEAGKKGNQLSVLLEYGAESDYTAHWLQEYGQTVLSENIFATIRQYFTP